MCVLNELDNFYKDFTGEKFVIGKSLFNKPIYCFKVAVTNRPVIIFQYAIHAREYITTHLALEQIKAHVLTKKTGTVYFIPAVNPDGIAICNRDNPLYKANGRGVDLNVNFDARWGTGKSNTTQCGSENYIGKFPFSEPETIALKEFTLKVKPDATVSYHSKGEEIYWQFFQKGKRAIRDLGLAQAVAKETGYNIKETPYSAGGYKDWCIEKLKIPALTIEVGSDLLSHPIKKEQLEFIYQKNRNVVQVVTDYVWEKLCKKNL